MWSDVILGRRKRVRLVMISVVLFDLDGVLVNTKELHYEAFNDALAFVKGDTARIPYDVHIKEFDGIPSACKVSKLIDAGAIKEEDIKPILQKKRELTAERFVALGLQEGNPIVDVLRYLKSYGLVLGLCSNSIRATVGTFIENSAFKEWDIVISNEDVVFPKPDAQMYQSAIMQLNATPDEVLIVEDSYVGVKAARDSGAHVMIVRGTDDVTLDRLESFMNPYTVERLQNLNILIPMAGSGTRFREKGYMLPKPLIPVHGKPMIQIVTDSIGIDGHYIFLAQKSHCESYDMVGKLSSIVGSSRVIQVNGLTEGACCTTLLASDYIDNDRELLMANSDQYIEWFPKDFYSKIDTEEMDACILTFNACEEKWSYAQCDNTGRVVRVAEKEVISDKATVGIYWWRHGRDYVRFAKQMIEKDIRVNGEYYVCPVFNEAIAAGLKVGIYDVLHMSGLGTPEDLEKFLSEH